MSTTLKQALSKLSNDYTPLEEKYARVTGTSLFLDPFAPPPRVKTTTPLTVSVVIPAWNARESILPCLTAIEHSSFNLNCQDRLHVVVVDDGSTDGTWEIIKKSSLSLNLTAIRQNHYGQAQALNTGISIAEGDIIISCDADMVLCYHTIEHLVARHQLLPNVLLISFRSQISKNDPQINTQYISRHGSPRGIYFTGDERIVFPVSGWPSNMCLASEHLKLLGNGKSLWMPDDDAWYLPDLVFGFLFSLPKSIYFNIGGYDDRFYGWGCTDGFLAVKAIANSQYVIPIYAASGLHINHPPRSGDNQQLEYKKNRARFFRFLRTCIVGNYPNWLSHAKNRIVESYTSQPARKRSGINKTESNQQRKEDNLSKIDCLLAIGEFSRVFAFLKNYPSKNKNEAWTLRLGRALLGVGRYREAIESLEEVSVSTELAIAQAADSQFEAARTTLKRLSQTHPRTPDLSYWYYCSAEKHTKQGIKYLNQKFYRIALRCFEAALIIELNNKKALKYRNQCLRNLSF